MVQIQSTIGSDRNHQAQPLQELPHGLIRPPQAVRERLELERGRHDPAVFARHEVRLLNAWTIGYVFDALGLEVIYLPTPQGPEVLAVGTDEVVRLRKSTPAADQRNLETYLGYA